MAKIDKMLEMMVQREIERAILIGDRPFQLFAGGRKVEGSLTPAEQLLEIVTEIVPDTFASMLRDGGAFHFRYQSPFGTFDIGVENLLGNLQVTIHPARPGTSTPKGKMYSTSSAEIPAAPKEPYAGAQTREMSPPPAITPVPKTLDVTAIVTTKPDIPTPLAPMAPAASTIGGFHCATHPERGATGICVYSGKFYCSECLVEVEGKLYGKDNLSYVLAEARTNAPSVIVNNSSHAVASPTIHASASVQQPAPVMIAGAPKSKTTAGLLGIFFGGLGIHRFYLGYTSIGFLQILVTLCTLGYGGLWGFVEGILLLAGVMNTDAEGRPLQS